MTVEIRTTVFRDLPEWLEEFTENLDNTGVPAPAHSSQDSDSDRTTKSGLKIKEAQYLYSLPKIPKIAMSACEPK